jgi:hypothetical protein
LWIDARKRFCDPRASVFVIDGRKRFVIDARECFCEPRANVFVLDAQMFL